MTVSSNDELKLAWLHCNVCHRSFDSYNTVRQSGTRIEIIRSEQLFFFTGCGHFFCSNCANNGQSSSSFCRICSEKTSFFPIEGLLPEKVSMYLRPPISLLEDSLSIMMFQLQNANKLIGALRSKIAHQKDLLNRARDELQKRPSYDESFLTQIPSHEPVINQQPFQQPNPNPYNHQSAYTKPSVNRVSKTIPFRQPPPSPIIHNPGRLSLKSPIITNTPSVFSSRPPRPFSQHRRKQ